MVIVCRERGVRRPAEAPVADLAWYDNVTLDLVDALRPGGYSKGPVKIEGCMVAFDGGFLHVVDKPSGRRGDAGEVIVIPAHRVISVRYRTPKVERR
jgi:hypothetical protein